MLQQSQSPQPCPAKPMGPCPTPTSAHPWLLRLALSQCPTCFLLLTRWDRPCMVKLLTKQQVWAIPVAPAPLPKALSLKSTLAAQLDHWNTIRCFNSLFFLHLLFQDIHVLQNATTCKCLADLTIKIASLASLRSVLAPSWIQLRLSVSVLLFKGQHETGLGNLRMLPVSLIMTSHDNCITLGNWKYQTSKKDPWDCQTVFSTAGLWLRDSLWQRSEWPKPTCKAQTFDLAFPTLW